MAANTAPGDEGLEQAEDAVQRGAWHEALALLRGFGGEQELSSAGLELLARSAYGSGDLEGAIEAFELLHTRSTASGDFVAAARAAVTIALYLLMDTGLMAPVRGWTARAERLIDGLDECEVHAWLAVVRTYERLMSGDMEQAQDWASRAIEVGLRQGTPAPVAFGRLATGRLAILDGDVEAGLTLLDETAATLLSGALDPLTIGMIYCELICAMQGLAQFDRAEQWTEAMERWRRSNAFGGINGRCRVHRAEILRLRGSCVEAEDEALHACEELRPWMRREYGWPLTELGIIRLRKGDLEGAEEAFLAAHENGWDPQPGLALLRLAQGKAATASELITHALDHPSNIPSKERPPYGGLRRAPLLAALAEIATVAGDVGAAHDAAEELSEIARTFHSRALSASADLARARVALAVGDASTAAAECARAVEAWMEVGAPYEASEARLVLGRCLRTLGDDEPALMELSAARSTFERIGARSRAQEAALACRELEDRREAPVAWAEPAPARPDPAAAGESVFRLDGDTRTVVYEGQTVLLRDLKGMRYLARLLAAPGREFHVLELVAAERGAPLIPPGPGSDELTAWTAEDAGPILDAHAKDAYRRRLQEIDDDIEEAIRSGDMERASRAEADRDYLVRELSRAFGLGGRDRKGATTSERARASVTRSLRYALARIGDHHPALAEHLTLTIRTGTYCGYFPDPRVPVRWDL